MIEALEVEGKVVVRGPKTYTAMRCARCNRVIPAGSLKSTQIAGRRVTDWAHVVCPGPSGAPPSNPKENPPPLTRAGGAHPTLPFPHDGDPPVKSATSGGAIVSVDQISEFGIRTAKVEGARRIVLELHEVRAQEVASRLVGPEFRGPGRMQDVS